MRPGSGSSKRKFNDIFGKTLYLSKKRNAKLFETKWLENSDNKNFPFNALSGLKLLKLCQLPVTERIALKNALCGPKSQKNFQKSNDNKYESKDIQTEDNQKNTDRCLIPRSQKCLNARFFNANLKGSETRNRINKSQGFSSSASTLRPKTVYNVSHINFDVSIIPDHVPEKSGKLLQMVKNFHQQSKIIRALR